MYLYIYIDIGGIHIKALLWVSNTVDVASMHHGCSRGIWHWHRALQSCSSQSIVRSITGRNLQNVQSIFFLLILYRFRVYFCLLKTIIIPLCIAMAEFILVLYDWILGYCIVCYVAFAVSTAQKDDVGRCQPADSFAGDDSGRRRAIDFYGRWFLSNLTHSIRQMICFFLQICESCELSWTNLSHGKRDLTFLPPRPHF